jgi:ABC-2 type transport system ATP-binding protein
MNEIVIHTEGLTKKYRQFVAVNSLDLQITKGEVFGLLGPNGSGKTTTILMLLGLTEPTAGQVRVLGFDPVRQPLTVKTHVGYLPDQVGFYEGLTARENLTYIAKLNGIARSEVTKQIEAGINQMGLKDVIDHKVGTFSRGMRQRLGLAELLLKHPQIIIMDEPTLGLDPEAAHMFLGMIRDLKATGITVLLSSHLLHQVQEVCDRVGLFYHGQMLLEGTVPNLSRTVLGGSYHIKVQIANANKKFFSILQGLAGVVQVETQTDGWYLLNAQDDIRTVVANEVINAGGQLESLDIEMPSLDHVYTRYFEEVSHVATA